MFTLLTAMAAIMKTFRQRGKKLMSHVLINDLTVGNVLPGLPHKAA